MSAVDPEARLRLLRELARRVPDKSRIDVNIAWENDQGRAGVYTSDEGATVFLNNAQEPISDLADAELLLRKIFADELVCVTGYDRDQMIFCKLAPADAVGSSMPPSQSGYEDLRSFRATDHVTVETWSRGLLEQE